MATDLEKLVVQLSADIKGYERDMRKAMGVTNSQARGIENRFRQMNRNLDGIGSRAARSLIAPLAGVSAALSVREVARYADAWTVAGNKTAAAGQIAGMQARSLEDLNKIADETRSGISDTVDLYAKLMRSAGGVAKSELEIARATEIVNKAFKAGGAAASEQQAGILQLSQGLGSGVLQGDELRSVRENAPILAQAIADYYGVSIAGLKKLGEEGRITAEGVFKAILEAGPKIQAAFATTNATIQDGMTKVSNAFMQYIGQTDDSMSASERLVAGLSALADNFENVADITLKVAAVLSAAMLGRSIANMVKNLGLGTGAIVKFVAAARAASTMGGLATAMSGLSAAAGPIGLLLGATAATAMVLFADASREAEARTERVRQELERLGLYTPQTTEAIDELSQSIDNLSSAQKIERIRDLRAALERLKGESILDPFAASRTDNLTGIEAKAQRGSSWRRHFFDEGFLDGDQEALTAIRDIASQLRQAEISGEAAVAALQPLEGMDLSTPAKQLLASLQDIANLQQSAETVLIAEGATEEMEAAQAALTQLREEIERMAAQDTPFTAIQQEMADLITQFEDGQKTAEETKAELERLGEANPSFKPMIASVNGAIGVLASLRAMAASAAAAVAAVGSGGAPADSHIQAFNAHKAAADETRKANEAYIAEQRRINSLSGQQLALEKEIAQVRKENPALPEDQAAMLAAENLAADARRSAESRKGRGGSGGGKKGKGKKEKEEPGLFEDVEQDILNLQREIGLIGQSTAEVAKAKAQWALLDEAKKRGIPVNDKLNAQIEAQSTQVGQLTAELERQEISQDRFNDAIDGIADSLAGALLAGESLRDGLAQVFKQIASDILSSGIRDALNSLFGGGGGFSWGSLFGGLLGGGDPLTKALRGAGLPARA
ncbi:tape measure protein, partial [Paracoccus sp. (in: a-proteobacteria)]|uniref:tape measure protein n=1 Tax=Paracoccus sp. TaxID=267 RepID=UPI0028A20E90